MIPYDKALHVIAGVVIFAAFHWIGDMLALFMVALIAATKEAYDMAHPETHTAEFGDFVYTILGGLLGYFSGLH